MWTMASAERSRRHKNLGVGNIVDLLANRAFDPFVFPSPPGNREQNLRRRLNLVAERSFRFPEDFELKTFRSTYATSVLRRVWTYERSMLNGVQVRGNNHTLFGIRAGGS